MDLNLYRDVAVVHTPNADDAVAADVIKHCERNRFRFAVVDSGPNQVDPT